MSKFDRAFQSGDEVQINKLYGRITGAYRTDEEYRWEWLKTWNGPGSIWLAFDEDREINDQLIAQYSLIPTPLSFWGKTILTGKTENCMSHPDFRGKGMYFFHERKFFEVAKSTYKVFFTTAGHVARGAPGKVRHKLGYKPYDYWETYSLWLDRASIINEIYSKLPGLLKKWRFLGRGLAGIISWMLLKFTGSSSHVEAGYFQDHSESDAPLNKIEKLWKNNAELYGISVNRTAEYMNWRINENPYLKHKYLCYYREDKLMGYIIYTVQDGAVHLVDILVDAKDKLIFRALFEQLKHLSRAAGHTQLKCHTLSKNTFLIERLREGKFLNFSELFSTFKKKKSHPVQLFIYVSDDVQLDQDVWDHQHWYFTDLVKEGRPYTARLIG